MFDVETLLTPPPDPFNLNPPAQHKVTSTAMETNTFPLSDVLPLGHFAVVVAPGCHWLLNYVLAFSPCASGDKQNSPT